MGAVLNPSVSEREKKAGLLMAQFTKVRAMMQRDESLCGL